MQTNHHIFLLVAQELSITKAADIACVTQQCVSDHIKRLEKQYGTQLVIRKPVFKLTEAGEVMQASLKKMYHLETDLDRYMEQYRSHQRGSFTVGISSSRSRIILPLILSRFYEMYPNVTIKFSMADTMVLYEKLYEGEIDLYFGIDSPYFEGFDYTHICDDQICVIITKSLLLKHAKDSYTPHMDRVKFSELEQVPFVRSFETSMLKHKVDTSLAKNRAAIHSPFYINDIYTQILLCSKGLTAGICPRMLLSDMEQINDSNTHNPIHVLSVDELDTPLRVELVKNKASLYPKFVTDFADLSVSILREKFLQL